MQSLRHSQLFPQSLLYDLITTNIFVDYHNISHYWNNSHNNGVVL
jgi:hypothetical protein